MSCVLRARGPHFDVDAFLKASSLDALTAFHRGEAQFEASSVSRRGSCSGMNISVSTRESSDLKGLVGDAIRFLTDNGAELRRLRDFPGSQRMDLDFPVEARDQVFQSDSFPPHLLSLLGELRIGLVVSRSPAYRAAEEQSFREQ